MTIFFIFFIFLGFLIGVSLSVNGKINLTYDKVISLDLIEDADSQYSNLAHNGSHFYIGTQGTIGVLYTFYNNGTELTSIGTGPSLYGIGVSPNSNTIWQISGASDAILRKQGSEGISSFSVSSSSPRGMFFNGSNFYWFETTGGAAPNTFVYSLNGSFIGNFTIESGVANRLTHCPFTSFGCDTRLFYSVSLSGTDKLNQYPISFTNGSTNPDQNLLGTIDLTSLVGQTINSIALNATHFWVLNGSFQSDSITQFTYISDIDAPIVNTTFNVTSPVRVGVINYTANITDNIGLANASWSVNLTTGTIYANYTLSGTSSQISNFTSLNILGVYNFTISAADSLGNTKQNSTLFILNNTLPSVASATINNSNPADTDDLECLNGSLSDNDGDSISLLYNWTKGGVDQAISTKTLSNTLTAPNDIWICRITPFDGFQNGSTKTSSSISIGSGNLAPTINETNVTPLTAELLKGEWLNLSVNFTDTNVNDLHTAYFCKTDSATSSGCSGGTWCLSPANVTGNFTSCRLNITDLTNFNIQTYSFYTFIVDDTTLISSSSTNTFITRDITPPVITYYNFSTLSIQNGNKLNLTINISENVSNLLTIKFNFTNPNSANLQRLNPTHFSLPSSTNLILNYTVFESSETAVNGIWNLTYIYVEDNKNNIVDSYPNLTFEVTAAPNGGNGGGGGGGGGGTSSLAPEKVVERKVEVAVERCGNFACEECDESSPEGCTEETPLSCPIDCRFFSLDEAFCTPIFNCGNWLKSWFLNGIILLVIGSLVFTQYMAKKKKIKRL